MASSLSPPQPHLSLCDTFSTRPAFDPPTTSQWARTQALDPSPSGVPVYARTNHPHLPLSAYPPSTNPPSAFPSPSCASYTCPTPSQGPMDGSYNVFAGPLQAHKRARPMLGGGVAAASPPATRRPTKALNPDKKLTVDLHTRCSICAEPLAKLILRGKRAELDVPYAAVRLPPSFSSFSSSSTCSASCASSSCFEPALITRFTRAGFDLPRLLVVWHAAQPGAQGWQAQEGDVPQAQQPVRRPERDDRLRRLPARHRRRRRPPPPARRTRSVDPGRLHDRNRLRFVRPQVQALLGLRRRRRLKGWHGQVALRRAVPAAAQDVLAQASAPRRLPRHGVLGLPQHGHPARRARRALRHAAVHVRQQHARRCVVVFLVRAVALELRAPPPRPPPRLLGDPTDELLPPTLNLLPLPAAPVLLHPPFPSLLSSVCSPSQVSAYPKCSSKTGPCTRPTSSATNERRKAGFGSTRSSALCVPFLLVLPLYVRST